MENRAKLRGRIDQFLRHYELTRARTSTIDRNAPDDLMRILSYGNAATPPCFVKSSKFVFNRSYVNEGFV